LDLPAFFGPGASRVWVQQKDYLAVGGVLAAAREKAGLTQKQLAKLLRKPQSFVSNYECGQRRIDVLELARIANALQTDPRKIFSDAIAHQGARKMR
jgi:transcriptional regulator with XRE-family HTH domain